ncbi:hypothetical protein [Desulfocicer vacuolatum]|nr:hypothetical protein [Desulfocicer vacuolatum]
MIHSRGEVANIQGVWRRGNKRSRIRVISTMAPWLWLARMKE